jgi:hypothetical protein
VIARIKNTSAGLQCCCMHACDTCAMHTVDCMHTNASMHTIACMDTIARHAHCCLHTHCCLHVHDCLMCTLMPTCPLLPVCTQFSTANAVQGHTIVHTFCNADKPHALCQNSAELINLIMGSGASAIGWTMEVEACCLGQSMDVTIRKWIHCAMKMLCQDSGQIVHAG